MPWRNCSKFSQMTLTVLHIMYSLKYLQENIHIVTELTLDDCDAGERSGTREISELCIQHKSTICTDSRHKTHAIAENIKGT